VARVDLSAGFNDMPCRIAISVPFETAMSTFKFHLACDFLLQPVRNANIYG
jgi:hypothetical protein